MKKLLIIAGLFAVITSVNAQGAKQNAIKLNPLSLAFMTGNLAYERAINHNQSLQIGSFYSGVSVGGLKYSGFGITPEYRVYFGGAKEALNGVYVAPFARYQSFNLTDKSTSTSTTFSSIGGGATLGWQKMWKSGFVLDLFAGPAYNSGKFKNTSDESQYDLSFGMNGFGVRTGITIGFGF
jgi:Protein of unknown function (DUF3575)